MINEIFKNSFLYEYFETFFKTKKRFPQSIIFEGQDILYGYFFALELARILNCENNSDDFNCNCTNCKWIKEGKHPCVISVTPLDFKEDSSNTVISVKQIEKITSLIRETSDYHRFFIFSNAASEPTSEKKQEKYFNAGYRIDLKNRQFLPLNSGILQVQAANALLKSTEEAPDKVSFIFLTDTRENILPTIVSRSLVFKIPFCYEKPESDLYEFFENYPNSA
ncbi:MAG: hypothetical protein LUE64_05165, partial [Candidatus Gastranaerophilales bacterium]|nr:hypothetical protein [Candidatus Gastranaerophilales bacterium]